MKKFFFLFLFLACLSINTYHAISLNKCTKEIYPTNLNSKEIIQYLKKENLISTINKICSTEICSSINMANLESDIKNFIDKNITYLKNKDEEIGMSAELKGFKIDKIIVYSCS